MLPTKNEWRTVSRTASPSAEAAQSPDPVSLCLERFGDSTLRNRLSGGRE